MHSLSKFTRMVWTQREGANASDIPEVHAECLQTPVKHEQGYICENMFWKLPEEETLPNQTKYSTL